MGNPFSDYTSAIDTGPSIVIVIVSSALIALFASLRWWPLVGFLWAFYGSASFAIGYRTCMRHVKDAVAERRPTE